MKSKQERKDILLKELYKITEPAQEELHKIIDAARKECNKIIDAAWDKYSKITEPPYKEYHKKRKEMNKSKQERKGILWEECEVKIKPFVSELH